MRFAQFILFALLVGSVVGQTPPVSKVDTSAVWNVTPQFLATAPEACAKAPKSDNGECLLGQMKKAGAPAAAVNFTRDLYKQSHGDFGVLTGFHAAPPVAVAFIDYPLRANTNHGLLLVNGKPPIVNVEDTNLLDKKTMEQSSQFQNLKAQFPKIDVWPGDRDGQTWPDSQPGPNGQTQFTVGYPLINGCHACERGGFAIFTWNFASDGKFLGTSFAGMTPPPLKH